MSDDRCATKYPLVLIHGAGFRDLKWPVYWGRIPGELEKHGAAVRYGLQDCWASVETNAAAFSAAAAGGSNPFTRTIQISSFVSHRQRSFHY